MAVGGERSDFHFDGDGFVFEVSGGDGGERFFVGVGGECVGLFAGDAELAGDVFRAEAHVDVGIGIVVDQPGIGGYFVAAHGYEGHGLSAASDDDFGGAAANALGGKGDSLQAGGAEAVDGHRGGFDGETGAERGDARDVHALLAFGHGAAENDVVDLFGVDGRNAGEDFFYGESGKIVGAGGAERAFVGAAYGSAYRGNDYGFWHGDLAGGTERRKGYCWPRAEKLQT